MRSSILLILSLAIPAMPAAVHAQVLDPLFGATDDGIVFYKSARNDQFHLGIISTPNRSITFKLPVPVTRTLTAAANGLVRIKIPTGQTIPDLIRVGNSEIFVATLPIATIPTASQPLPTSNFKTATGEIVLVGQTGQVAVSYLSQVPKTVVTDQCGLGRVSLKGTGPSTNPIFTAVQTSMTDPVCVSTSKGPVSYIPVELNSFSFFSPPNKQLKFDSSLVFFKDPTATNLEVEYQNLVTRNLTAGSNGLLRIRPLTGQTIPDSITVNNAPINVATLPIATIPTASQPLPTSNFKTATGEVVLVGQTGQVAVSYEVLTKKILSVNACEFAFLGTASKPAPTTFKTNARAPFPILANHPTFDMQVRPLCRSAFAPTQNPEASWQSKSTLFIPLTLISSFHSVAPTLTFNNEILNSLE